MFPLLRGKVQFLVWGLQFCMLCGMAKEYKHIYIYVYIYIYIYTHLHIYIIYHIFENISKYIWEKLKKMKLVIFKNFMKKQNRNRPDMESNLFFPIIVSAHDENLVEAPRPRVQSLHLTVLLSEVIPALFILSLPHCLEGFGTILLTHAWCLLHWNVVSLRPAATLPQAPQFGLPFGCPAPRLSPHCHFPPSSFYISGGLYPS